MFYQTQTSRTVQSSDASVSFYDVIACTVLALAYIRPRVDNSSSDRQIVNSSVSHYAE